MWGGGQISVVWRKDGPPRLGWQEAPEARREDLGEEQVLDTLNLHSAGVLPQSGAGPAGPGLIFVLGGQACVSPSTSELGGSLETTHPLHSNIGQLRRRERT